MALPVPPDNANPGDPGHSTDHNLIRSAILQIDADFLEKTNIIAGSNVGVSVAGKNVTVSSNDTSKLVPADIQAGSGITVTNGSGNARIITATGGGGGSTIENRDELVVTFSGNLVQNSVSQIIPVLKPFKLLSVRLSAVTAPTASPGVTVDVLKTGPEVNTSVFPTLTRPRLDPGKKWQGMVVEGVQLAAGDFIQVQVTTVGTGTSPGADLSVSLEIEYIEGTTYFTKFDNKGSGNNLSTGAAVTTGVDSTGETQWSSLLQGAGSTAVYETAATSGASALGLGKVVKFSTATGQNNLLKYNFPTNVKELYVRMYCRYAALAPAGFSAGTATLSAFLRAFDPAGAVNARLQLDTVASPVGAVVLHSGTATIGTAVGTGIVANDWFRVELRMVAGNTAGQNGFYKLDVYNSENSTTPTQTISANYTGWTGWSSIEFGRVAGTVETPPTVHHMAGFFASNIGYGGAIA
jgi:hypothetical protein